MLWELFTTCWCNVLDASICMVLNTRPAAGGIIVFIIIIIIIIIIMITITITIAITITITTTTNIIIIIIIIKLTIWTIILTIVIWLSLPASTLSSSSSSLPSSSSSLPSSSSASSSPSSSPSSSSSSQSSTCIKMQMRVRWESDERLHFQNTVHGTVWNMESCSLEFGHVDSMIASFNLPLFNGRMRRPCQPVNRWPHSTMPWNCWRRWVERLDYICLEGILIYLQGGGDVLFSMFCLVVWARPSLRTKEYEKRNPKDNRETWKRSVREVVGAPAYSLRQLLSFMKLWLGVRVFACRLLHIGPMCSLCILCSLCTLHMIQSSQLKTRFRYKNDDRKQQGI